jgi:predicted nucleotidyltransferase
MPISKNKQEKLNNLIDFLQQLPETGCCWYEGSFARNEQDEFSDVDLWVDCENGKEKELLFKIVKFLSQAENKEPFVAHNFFQNHPEIHQNYIIIDDFILDVCIQSQSRTSKVFFAQNEEVKIIFDKNNAIQFSTELRPTKYTEDLNLLKNFIIAKSLVLQNKAKRGKYFSLVSVYFNFLEDVILYHLIKNNISKCSYPMHSVYKDAEKLDESTKKTLQDLFKINSIEEISANLNKIKQILT